MIMVAKEYFNSKVWKSTTKNITIAVVCTPTEGVSQKLFLIRDFNARKLRKCDKVGMGGMGRMWPSNVGTD